MPWQTNVIMTREIDTWRVTAKAKRISPFLLLAMASLKVVHAQFNFLIMMQTNREDLSQRYKELLLPIPRTEENRNKWSKPIKEYFESNVRARNSYEELLEELDTSLFEDRP